MKKMIYTALLALATFAAQNTTAQTVKGIKISDITADYLEVTEYRPLFSEKVCIRLEYGQKVIDFLDDAVIKDDSGKNMDFDSALNFVNKMRSYGYELFQIQFVSRVDISPLKYYILKRKLPSSETGIH